MKKLLAILLFSIAFSCFAQTDTILENSYIRMLEKRYDELDIIEGIWELETTTTSYQGKKVIDVQKKLTRVAIYKAGKLYAITYLTREPHVTEQITMLSDDEYYYERPAENISAGAILQGIQLRISLSTSNETKNYTSTEMVFNKVYPEGATTRQH